MSRAINVDATEAYVVGVCAKHDAVITSIETLHSGGTRVVLANGDSAAIVRRAFAAKVIDGSVQRQPHRVAHSAFAAPAVATPASQRSPLWEKTRER